MKFYDKAVKLEFLKSNPKTFKPGLPYTAYVSRCRHMIGICNYCCNVLVGNYTFRVKQMWFLCVNACMLFEGNNLIDSAIVTVTALNNFCLL